MSPRQLLGQTADVPSGRFIPVLLCALLAHTLALEAGVEPDLQEKSDQQLLILAREDSRALRSCTAVITITSTPMLWVSCTTGTWPRTLPKRRLHGSPVTSAGSPRHADPCCHGCTAWRVTVRWMN